MKNYAPQDLRNICLVGAQGEGKTLLAETMLFNAGVTNRQGKIEEGNTVCDYTEEEIARKISITLSLAFIEEKDKKINMLVTPGYGDFVGDMVTGLAVADTAIFVVGGDTGLSPSAQNIWEYLEDKKIPTVLFLNKLDKENLNFDSIIASLKEKLGQQVVPITVPNATGAGISSLENILDESIPDSEKPHLESFTEAVSSTDDALTEKFLDGKPISMQELKSALAKAIKERKIFPLLSGSSTKNIGVKELTSFIAEHLPSPALNEKDSSFSALCFKTINEQGLGHINFIKVFSGSVGHGKDIANIQRQMGERVGQMCFVQGKKKTDTPSAAAGDIVGILKLKDTRTNDILSDPKTNPAVKQIELPATVFDRAISAKSKGEEEKMGNALSIIALENPTVRYHFSNETKEMVMSGMGSLQLEITVQKIKSKFGVEIELKPPRVPYKETVRGKSEVQGKYKRQTGGHGQYGDCWLRIEPLERGKGFEFVDKIVGGVIPKNFIPAVEKGVKEAMEQGVIAGYPVMDTRVTVFDGSYHDVDSSEMAFKIAGSMALRKAVTEAKPSLLEPIMIAEIFVPPEYMGTIMGDLNSRRGRVLGMDKVGSKEVIKATVPLAEMYQYATDLRSMTKGSGRFSMKADHYQETPPHIAQPLIETYTKSRSADADK
ncbi:MAG: elongation factor G [Elusimicrobiota bacterium]